MFGVVAGLIGAVEQMKATEGANRFQSEVYSNALRAKFYDGMTMTGSIRADTHEAPCGYCGRTKQTYRHKSCDGCGAPKSWAAE